MTPPGLPVPIRYDITADRADPGYPKTINRETWPGVWPYDFNAAVNWGNGKTYFFFLQK